MTHQSGEETRHKGGRRLPVRRLALSAGITAAALLAVVWNSPAGSTTASTDLIPPIRAAFYYPWYPEHWQESPQFKAGLGEYDSADPLVIGNHIAQMEFAHIDAGIASWWGRGSAEDNRIIALLNAAQSHDFKWTLYYEHEYYSSPTTTKLKSDLDYIFDSYASHPSYLRVGGKPVLFVFTGNNAACTRLSAWWKANQGRFYLSFRAPSGTVMNSCRTLADSWHVYDPSSYWSRLPGYSTTIAPGFWSGQESSPRLARNIDIWSWVAMGAKYVNDPWQLVTTWNEWPESTGIEPDGTHGFDYIRALNKYWSEGK
ncbi:MAG: hypothetical protein Q7T33_03040 [Dehalococcoidia bacterium]|nr:hypothetical protein [Dehalococcoidia bacterium]